LARLKAQPDVFARVEPIPGVFAAAFAPTADPYGVNSHYNYNYSYSNAPPTPAADDKVVREELQKMRRMTADMGLDYLLLVGGTIDHVTDTTGWAAADLTIIGAFVVPSRTINAEGRATAVLIDVRTNRVVLTSSADARDQKFASSVAQGEEQTKLLRAVRNEVLSKAAEQLAQNCRQRGGVAVANTSTRPGANAGNLAAGPIVIDDPVMPAAAPRSASAPPRRPVGAPAPSQTEVRDEFWK
jgi:hypothetical protein